MINKFMLFVVLFFNATCCMSQNQYLNGISLDSLVFDEFLSNYYGETQTFFVYKPQTFNPINCKLLFAIHGQGGNGISAISDLDSIAERRNAIIIAPNYPSSGFACVMRHQDPTFDSADTVSMCISIHPATYVMDKIYKHVLMKEGLNSIPSYMIGFSAGGQFVSRYMLVRQGYPDNIPIQMAVSSNAFYYTFPTDSFQGIPMIWTCGLIMPTYALGDCYHASDVYGWNCNDHVIQYYNENYGILIGTNDLSQLTGGACSMSQGNNRYERALNFYNFADSNATNRGTILQWQYEEIPGVAHDQYAMYNTKYFSTDSSTIAETLLFDTPHHNVPSLVPIANFDVDTTIVELGNSVNFINTSTLSTSYSWNFGDSTSSQLTNPMHTYTSTGSFTVQLTAINGVGCDNWIEKRHYITVIDPVSVHEFQDENIIVSIFPNPTTSMININLKLLKNHSELYEFSLVDIVGKEIIKKVFEKNSSLDISSLVDGIYTYRISNSNSIVGFGKIVKR